MDESETPNVPMSQAKSVAFEIAIVDGINIFVRTVLGAKGIIAPERLDAIGSEEVLKLKYEIARGLARQWSKMPIHADEPTR